MKVKQSKQELLRHLHDHLMFLKSSSESFDNGHVGEAKRLAVTIRVLFHDTKNSKSLLGQLKMKDGTGYLDTSFNLDIKNTVSHLGLVGTKATPGNASYYAFLSRKVPGQLNKYVFFPKWWNKSVLKDNNKNSFTRRDIILALANTDGGAHVDPKLDSAYAELTRNNSVGISFKKDDQYHSVKDVELHTVRQITYEVVTSIERIINKMPSIKFELRHL